MINKKSGGFEWLLGGFSDLVEKLGELAEKGEQLSQTGEIDFKQKGKSLKGLYGFSVKVGLGGDEVKIEPFGNIRKDKETGEAVVQEIREPVADVFEEKDYTLIVVEMPGISENDVQIEVKDDLLTLYAEDGEKKYRKEILMPKSYPKEKMRTSCNNGILEIKCTL
ncbi:MAG: Hsp20/alpha crystallin family protein [Candidatus Coatesbacteria bacterium]|nr:Hsp20/alpha crystallin family protein [Candidatus Coatesbacteria bacterium]